MNKPVRLCIFGSESIGWALDIGRDLLLQTYKNMPDEVILCSLKEAEVVHGLWEVNLFKLPPEALNGKRVICNITNDFYRKFEQPTMIDEGARIGGWVAQSQEAEQILDELGKPVLRLRYCVDTDVFTPAPPNGLTPKELRRRWQIPEESIVISNFMRDSLGSDLGRPKEQKATQLLLELLTAVSSRFISVHVLLAGPRRHWLRSQLRERNVPVTFVGREVPHDDMDINVIDRNTMNLLYHASDLHLISSRWEGGPRPALEAAATQTPILTTPVGAAKDFLDEHCLYRDFDEGMSKLLAFVQHRDLIGSCGSNLKNIQERHTPQALVEPMRELLRRLDDLEPYEAKTSVKISTRAKADGLRRYTQALGNVIKAKKPGFGLNFCLWHKFHRAPWGGGNQFMKALKGALRRLGARVTTNRFSRLTDIHICNSCSFDVSRIQHAASSPPLRVIHRVDGPVSLYRGDDGAVDAQIHEFNRQYASATVYQSAYCMRMHRQLGFEAIRPVIFHNAVDTNIFNAKGREPYSQQQKVRLITSAWSDNRLKGGPFLKWLDANLDWDRFEYTFVGRTFQQFKKIRHIPPVKSRKLAGLLRQHDVFISASLHEPCSNALLEALACGCPAIYRNTGGNKELVGFAGMPFNDHNDILIQLDRMVERLAEFQSLIQIRPIDDVAKQYVDLARQIIERT